MAAPWEMRITGIFRLSDGRTALTGIGVGWTPVVRRAPCHIVVDGEVVERLAVSTEMLQPAREGRWSFGTMEEVKLDETTVMQRPCLLRPITND
jgi:hypothetical protein